jgi:hypothetical protein
MAKLQMQMDHNNAMVFFQFCYKPLWTNSTSAVANPAVKRLSPAEEISGCP